MHQIYDLLNQIKIRGHQFDEGDFPMTIEGSLLLLALLKNNVVIRHGVNEITQLIQIK